MSYQGSKLKKKWSRHFATSYEKLVASSQILVAKKINRINMNLDLQMINKTIILLLQQLSCHL